MLTTLYLARHGETESVANDWFNGRTDVALSERGRAQARTLGERLKRVSLAAVFASPLLRARETAALVAQHHGLTPQTVADLAEIDYGLWEGLPRQAIIARYPHEWHSWEHDPAVNAPPEGETGYRALARFSAAVTSLVAAHRGATILVVGHKAVNRLLLCSILGMPPRDYRRRIEQQPCAINCIVWDAAEPRVMQLNDVAHYAQLS